MEQHQLSKGPLLNEEGNLNEAGFAYKLVKKYDRNQIKGLKWRIKEWDYYYFSNKEYGIALTVADNSYMWLVGATFFDFKKKTEDTTNLIGFFSFGKINFPGSSETGDVVFKKKKFQFQFLNNKGQRHLLVHMDAIGKEKKKLDVDLTLTETTEGSMVIATPFNKKGHFYYNQKINLLKSKGTVKVNDQVYDFNDCYGVLDWGRGVWTYKNTWYWASLNSVYQGHTFGFNLGYGFGDTSNGTENMFFFDKEIFKLDDVIFNIPTKNGKDDFLSPWTFTSKNGNIDLKFVPILDRHSDSNVLLIRSNQHQVFGNFSGTISINKQKYRFENLLGFAEKVYNRW